MENNNDLVEITINHKGSDVVAVVTIEEANILLNDEAAAANYVESLLTQVTQPVPSSADQTDNTFWSRQATLLFLKLRTDFNNKFNDRKTVKQSLWQKIASELRIHGFDIPEGREGAEKCRQKFANLQRTYLNYIKHIKTTGEEKKDPPPYFNEVDAILRNKDKVHPPYVEDSLDTSSNDVIDESTASCSNSCLTVSTESNSCYSTANTVSDKQKEIKNRFRSSDTSIRPTSNFTKVVELFKEQHAELRQDRERHMKVLEDAIRVQNDQRDQFLAFLKRTEKRKRRRDRSSSSSDS
ncbi:hypothetical protein FQR65_LT10931 [Abscondita terminalis]|nr:hypothetical protein FQR65_LT10931 [Abscondita terminalis]